MGVLRTSPVPTSWNLIIDVSRPVPFVLIASWTGMCAPVSVRMSLNIAPQVGDQNVAKRGLGL